MELTHCHTKNIDATQALHHTKTINVSTGYKCLDQQFCVFKVTCVV